MPHRLKSHSAIWIIKLYISEYLNFDQRSHYPNHTSHSLSYNRTFWNIIVNYIREYHPAPTVNIMKIRKFILDIIKQDPLTCDKAHNKVQVVVSSKKRTTVRIQHTQPRNSKSQENSKNWWTTKRWVLAEAHVTRK